MNDCTSRNSHPQTLSRHQALRLAVLPAMLMAAVGYTDAVWAVQDGVVAAGSGTINTRGNQTTISQTSDKMVVNWKNFDIGKKESVSINQPGATSAVLNRVTTPSPTQIDGTLTANGRVFVVNPAGIMFGKTAKVDVGSLVASTLTVDNKQFMDGGDAERGRLYLSNTGDGGTVTNEGKLNAREEVVLLGRNAINNGTIQARDVTLGAARGATMKMDDSRFAVALGSAAEKALAANHGVISTRGGDITLSAAATGAMLATVVQNTGRLEATQAGGYHPSVVLLSQEDGRISTGGRTNADYILIASSVGMYADSPLGGGSTKSYGSTGHDVTVETGAVLNAPNVEIQTSGGKVAMNGRINGDTVTVGAFGDSVTTNGAINGKNVKITGLGVTINAPVNASQNVSVIADKYSTPGDLTQNANVKATAGSVSLSGNRITQAPGVYTVAGDSVTMTSANGITVANVSGKSVSVDGNMVFLNGNVRADEDVNVRARAVKYHCTAGPGEACIDLYSIGGAVVQNGNVISRNGNVSIQADGVIGQSASSRTQAGNNITLTAGSFVDAGINKAANAVVIDSRSAYLGGKLTAPNITLPENTVNVKGNVSARSVITHL